jgi:Concanavalin A-like lectin/glucanases superfamily
MISPVLIAAPLLIAAIVMAVRFVGCGLATGGLEAGSSYSGTVSGTGGLVSFWQLDDTSGTTAVDSADSNNGKYQGGFAPGANGLLDSSASDSGNKAAEFDGNSGEVTVPIKPNLSSPSFTVEALVQPSAIDSNTHVIVACGTGYQLVLNGNDFEASVADNGAFQSPVVVHAKAQGGTPFYVATTYDAPSKTLQLFVNPAASDGFGTFQQSENTGDKSFAFATVTYKAATSGNLRIGASANGGPSEFFSGVIQDVAVYSRALSFCEIVQHYWIFATGYLVPCSGSGAGIVGGLTGKGTLSANKVGFPPNGPTTTKITTLGANTYDIPYWCTFIDLILVGGGGGGSYSSFANGVGGAGGQLVGQTFQRGNQIPWTTTTIAVTVGSGGTAGTGTVGPTAGGHTTATWTGKAGMPLTAGGGGAMASPMGQTGTGTSPGSVTVNSTSYSGGANQTTAGGPGNAPGGAGAGGSGLDLEVAGGAGAGGAAYVVARQS